jgi:ATP-dependent DNA ligase
MTEYEAAFVDLPNSKTPHWGWTQSKNERNALGQANPCAQVRFMEWTAEGHLRHASFLGLRTDKKVLGVHWEA